MNFSNFKRKTAGTKTLNQVDILGSYDFFTTIISFDSLRQVDIESMNEVYIKSFNTEKDKTTNLTAENYIKLQKVLPLAAHEYTHFIDSTSTIWGLKHLLLMSSGYCSSTELGGDESIFCHAKDFYDHTRTIRLPKYYTVVYESIDNSQPWQASTTIGKVFSSSGKMSNRPVLFSKFLNAKGELLARSPISTVSILEASAMSQEVLMNTEILALTEGEFQLVETGVIKRKMLTHIYNKSITEYSVCVHLLANLQECTDILASFRLCGAICRLVLNCTDEVYDAVLSADIVDTILGFEKGNDTSDRIREGLQCRDLGVLYYMLCNALPPLSYENSDSIVAGIKSSIAALGYDISELEASRALKAESLVKELKASKIETIRELATAAELNYQKLDLLIDSLPFQDLNLPPALLGDSNSMHVFGSKNNSLEDFDIDDCFDELFKGQSWVTRFSEACIEI